MIGHRSILISACLVLLMLALSACQPIQAPAALTPTPEAEAEAATINDVTFTAVEYSFDAPESVPAGWTRITIENQGELPHDIMLFKVEEGRTMDDVMAALEAEGPPEWAEFFGSTSAQAGASNWFATNLTPGPYIYLSFGESEEGPPDAAQGMMGTLTVTEATGPVADDAPIDADASIELVDYQFIVNGTLTAGEQVLRVINTGSELHEVIFFKLREGRTIDDFWALLEQEMGDESVPDEGETPDEGEMPDDDEMPGDFAGAIFLSPGIVTYVTQELEAGTYILVCFIPSPTHDMQPHAMLGMIQEITVE
jgi:uncharacterized cupredoxin-like copper-binding protein